MNLFEMINNVATFIGVVGMGIFSVVSLLCLIVGVKNSKET
jgi:hypothetical protein